MARARSSTLAPSSLLPGTGLRYGSELEDEVPSLLDPWHALIWRNNDLSSGDSNPALRHRSIDATAAARPSSALAMALESCLDPTTIDPALDDLNPTLDSTLDRPMPMVDTNVQPPTPMTSNKTPLPPGRMGRDRASTLAVGATIPNSLQYSLACPSSTRSALDTPDEDPVLAAASLVAPSSATGGQSDKPMSRRASAGPLLAPSTLPPSFPPSLAISNSNSMASKALWDRLGHLTSEQPSSRRRAASMMGPPESHLNGATSVPTISSSSLANRAVGSPPLYSNDMARHLSALTVQESPSPSAPPSQPPTRAPAELAPPALWNTRSRAGTVGAFASSSGGYAPLATLPSPRSASSRLTRATVSRAPQPHQPSVPSLFAQAPPILDLERERSHSASLSPAALSDPSRGPSSTHMADSSRLQGVVEHEPVLPYVSSTVGHKVSAHPTSVPTASDSVYAPPSMYFNWNGFPIPPQSMPMFVPYDTNTVPGLNTNRMAAGASPSPVQLPASATAPTATPPVPNAINSLNGSTPAAPAKGPPPSRALWIGSLPPHLSNSALTTLFRRWGPLEGTRILSIKNCAFVNFVNLDDAIAARAAIVGTRWDAWDHAVGLGLGLDAAGFDAGLIKSEFAKAPLTAASPHSTHAERTTQKGTDDAEGTYTSPNIDSHGAPPAGGTAYSAVARERDAIHGLFSTSNSIVPSSDRGGVALPPEMAITANLNDQRAILAAFGPIPAPDDPVSPSDELPPSLAYDPQRPKRFSTLLPAPPRVTQRFGPTRLREIRRILDTPTTPQWDVDRWAQVLMVDVPALASDYLGNVLVQRLFERASHPIRLAMLTALAPHLARIGCHKNGTWAAQKILECIGPNGTNATPELVRQELSVAVECLAPYVPPLLLDQFGNYVVQGLLRFGPPHTDPIFHAFLEQTWEIAQGRFGARSMRALLDHPLVTARQKRLAALGIVLCAVPLSCSANGTILLHWLLDDPFGLFTRGTRHALLAERLGPYWADLATHKLGSVILVRMAQQVAEPEVARQVVTALFEPGAQASQDPLYPEIMADPVHGTQVIAQVLSAPALESEQRTKYTDLARTLAQERGLANVPAHRMLCEAVGLVPVGAPRTPGTE